MSGPEIVDASLPLPGRVSLQGTRKFFTRWELVDSLDFEFRWSCSLYSTIFTASPTGEFLPDRLASQLVEAYLRLAWCPWCPKPRRRACGRRDGLLQSWGDDGGDPDDEGGAEDPLAIQDEGGDEGPCDEAGQDDLFADVDVHCPGIDNGQAPDCEGEDIPVDLVEFPEYEPGGGSDASSVGDIIDGILVQEPLALAEPEPDHDPDAVLPAGAILRPGASSSSGAPAAAPEAPPPPPPPLTASCPSRDQSLFTSGLER